MYPGWRDSGLEAARLSELSTIITGVTRDIDRRLEEGMRASTRY